MAFQCEYNINNSSEYDAINYKIVEVYIINDNTIIQCSG